MLRKEILDESEGEDGEDQDGEEEEDDEEEEETAGNENEQIIDKTETNLVRLHSGTISFLIKISGLEILPQLNPFQMIISGCPEAYDLFDNSVVTGLRGVLSQVAQDEYEGRSRSGIVSHDSRLLCSATDV